MDEKSEIQTLLDLGKSFYAPIGKIERVKKIVDAAVTVTNADRGTVFLVENKKSLKSLIATGMDGHPIRVSVDQGIVGYIVRTQQAILINHAQNDIRFNPAVDKKTHYETRQILGVPLLDSHQEVLGVIEVLNSKNGAFTESDLQILRVVSLFTSLALEWDDQTQKIRATQRKPSLGTGADLSRREGFMNSKYPEIQKIYDQLKSYAKSGANVLILGESGTGKEGVARELHLKGPRRNGPFIALNCAAIPETLFEAELFGVAEGAATGTIARKGKIELANHGTLFLDEVGDLPLFLQAKLLRALEDKNLYRVGSERESFHSDFRLVCATHRDLEADLTSGHFREDLYYRINVAKVELAPLRDRLDDLPDLANYILEDLNHERSLNKTFSKQALQKIRTHSWPGNIRELRNKIEFAMIQSEQSSTLLPEHFSFTQRIRTHQAGLETEMLPQVFKTNISSASSLREMRLEFDFTVVNECLKNYQGNHTRTAKALGISRETLRQILNRRRLVLKQAS